MEIQQKNGPVKYFIPYFRFYEFLKFIYYK